LNADPGADAELPGVFGVVSQLAFGCPVVCVVVLAEAAAGLIGIDLAGIDLAGSLTRVGVLIRVALAVPDDPPVRVPPAAKAAAESARDKAHIVTLAVTGFSLRVFIRSPGTQQGVLLVLPVNTMPP